MTFKYR